LDDGTDGAVHWVDVGTARSGDVICDVACSKNQTVSRAMCVSSDLLEDKELPGN